MYDISTITLPSGTRYNIKDQSARDSIAALESAMTSAMKYIGKTTTALRDGSTTNPITIDGQSVTAVAGNVTIYQELEFVFSGAKWQELGSSGSLKALAFKDTASTSYQPSGSVSKPTFTGSAATGSTSYTPAGTVDTPVFTGKPATVSFSITPTGAVSISKASSGTINYTPEGSVAQPVTTVTMATTTVNSITDVGTLPSFSSTVSGETLTLSWSAGTLPTKGRDTTVATGVNSAVTSKPKFTGTGVRLEGSFNGSSVTGTADITPEGTIGQPKFTGTPATISISTTAKGSVSQPTFTGNTDTITVS